LISSYMDLSGKYQIKIVGAIKNGWVIAVKSIINWNLNLR
jgi:hypothetical protein